MRAKAARAPDMLGRLSDRSDAGARLSLAEGHQITLNRKRCG
jgi:hypothetical protein